MMMRYSLISPFLACEVTPLPDRTVQHIKLQELDRLRPGLDLSSYYDRSQNSQAISLKLNPIGKLRRLCMAWDEPHLYKSIPPHPNIVSFGRNLLEDVDSRVTGITTKYIPGGTFDKSMRPFRFKHPQQLTRLVDFFNLDPGVMCQNIAPRKSTCRPRNTGTPSLRLWPGGIMSLASPSPVPSSLPAT